jgi:hypothetical protein
MQAWGEAMFKLSFRLLLVACVLAHSGCAYTLKETGHRDLDRSVRACDECCACVAAGALCASACAAIGWLSLTSDEGLTIGGSDDSESETDVLENSQT